MRQSIQLFMAVLVCAFFSSATAYSQTTEEPVNVFVSTSSTSNQINVTAFTVPTTKRLLIEYISLRASVPAGQTVTDMFMNRPHVHFFVVFKQGRDISGRDILTAAQTAPIIISGGDTIIFRAQRGNFGTNASLDATIAGKLVPE